MMRCAHARKVASLPITAHLREAAVCTLSGCTPWQHVRNLLGQTVNHVGIFEESAVCT